MKRIRDELEEGGDDGEDTREQAAPEEPAAAAEAQPEDEEDDKPLMSHYKMSRSVRKGAECPYLDTISRQVRRRRCRQPPPSTAALRKPAFDCFQCCSCTQRHCSQLPCSPICCRTWISTLKSAAP